MTGLLKALIKSIRALFEEHVINAERPEAADITHHDDMQCRHCGHIHTEPDGSCVCGCSISEI